MFSFSFVFAQSLPSFTIKETINKDKTITALVSFTPKAAAAGTIKIKYNTDTLELLSAVRGSANTQTITINANEKGIFYANFLNAEGEVGGSTELAVLKFSIKSNNISADDIYAESFKLYDIYSKLISDNSKTNIIYDVNSDNAPVDVSMEGPPQNQSEKSNSQSRLETSQKIDISRPEQNSSVDSPDEKSFMAESSMAEITDTNSTVSDYQSESIERSTDIPNLSSGTKKSNENVEEKSRSTEIPESNTGSKNSYVPTDSREGNSIVSEKGKDNGDNGAYIVIILFAVILAATVFVLIVVKKINKNKE